MNYAKTLRKIKKDNKEYIKQEHERLRKIQDFQKGCAVQLMYKSKIINDISGDGRRYIGELYRLIKDNK